MSTRNARRKLRADVSRYLRSEVDGRATLDLAVVWLGQLPGFERTTQLLREAVVINVLGRELCEFEAFVDDFGIPGIRLVDPSGRQLSLADLTAARLRVKLKGALGHG